MNESARMIVVLTVIAMVSGGLLAAVYDWTSGVIAENQLKEMESAVFAVLPGAVRIELLDRGPAELVEDDPKASKETKQAANQVFVGYNEQGAPVGYAFVGEGNGYGGIIRIMVGVSEAEGKILNLTVLSHSETPGLGSRIEDAGFRNQFVGKTLSDPIAVGRDINALSGATISSRAVTEAVRRGLEQASAVYERSR